MSKHVPGKVLPHELKHQGKTSTINVKYCTKIIIEEKLREKFQPDVNLIISSLE